MTVRCYVVREFCMHSDCSNRVFVVFSESIEVLVSMIPSLLSMVKSHLMDVHYRYDREHDRVDQLVDPFDNRR